MGIMQQVKRVILGAPAPQTFAAETPPRPIAEVLLAMSGAGLLPRVGRAEALSVAPVLRARNLICGISTLPLIQYDADWNREDLPLLAQIDPDVANVVTLAQTVEDLLFEGISWWEITRWDSADYPTYARHLDYSSVSLQPPGGHTPAPLPGGYDPRGAVIYYDGRPIDARRVIRFDSPNPGLLTAAGRSIRRAVLLDTTSSLYADNPRPLDYFSPSEGADPANDETVQELLNQWASWRKTRVTGYVPAALKYNPVDVPSPADMQLAEQQKQAYLAIANATGLDPEDLGISTTSRTYQNATDRRQDRINDTYSPYMAGITQRLSMPDVTKRGRRVFFDLDDYLKADPLTRATVYEKAKAAGWLHPDEMRTEERRPPLTTMQKLDLAPPAPPEPGGSAATPVSRGSAATPVSVSAAADDHLHLSFDVPAATFAVDAERRIIEGVVVPYGPDAVAVKNGRRWRFQQGSLVPEHPDLTRNKLLRDHDMSQPQGPQSFREDRPDGMFVRFKVGRGPDGDRTLAEAEDNVRDGFSVGVDIIDWTDDPLNQGVGLVAVGGAVWYETSILAIPAFTGARVTRVAATRDNGDTMETCATCGASLTTGVTHTCPTTEVQPQTPAPLQLSNDQLQGLLAVPGVLGALAGVPAQGAQPAQPQAPAFALTPEQIGAILATPNGRHALFGLGAPEPARPTVDPTRQTAATQVREPSPYRFDRKGNLTKGTHDFSQDMIKGLKDRDQEALNRAEKFVREQFEQFDTDMADAATLNPNRNRPDLYVDQKDYRTPLWDAVSKGTLADMTPFVLPKFNTSSGMVAAHVEGVEPGLGVFTATAQTITPSAVSGKVSITREAWDQGGNPQLSGLIWRQMTRAWFEALEASVVTLLEAAAPTTITVPTAAQDDTLVSYVESALAGLQFVRGGFRMQDAFAQVDFYQALVGATDADGRKLLPILGPTNAAGQVASRYGSVSVGGLAWEPAWALAASGTVTANSYLFDRADVSGWATAPQRLTFENVEVRYIHVGIWGYKALAITDLTGVRRFAYDPS
jgi:portal protein